MTRDDLLQDVLNLQGKNFLLELPTGSGKSKIALNKVKQLCTKKSKDLLIVVPRNALKENWKEEIKKWWANCPLSIEYTTYVSFPKYKGNWDFIIYDESHHLSERCRESLCDFNVQYSILLSATISKSFKDELREVFDNISYYKKDLRSVIDESILPDPKVYLWPLDLDNTNSTELIIKNPKAKGKSINVSWEKRWNYLKVKTNPIYINCTEKQYHYDLCNQIEYWKKRYMRSKSQISKNKWLRLCNDRLVWLSNKKIRYVKQLLPLLQDYRTLTFCNSIEQTEILGKYCINSKNDKSIQYLEEFNAGKINHITACSMLNEGMNLTNCQIGIYANLNSSDIIIRQRTGRILRHPNPVIIIPYFKSTREAEILDKMLEDYNPNLVSVIKDLSEIKI